MTSTVHLREGTPSRSVALVLATFGFLVFAAMSLAILLFPETLRLVHYVLAVITATIAIVIYPWQILDVRNRKHILTEEAITYRCGILSRYQIDIPYRSVQAVGIRQGILQRVFGCGDVRVAAHGVQGPVTVSSQDLNSVCIRSIPDFEEVAQAIRERMTADGVKNV